MKINTCLDILYFQNLFLSKYGKIMNKIYSKIDL